MNGLQILSRDLLQLGISGGYLQTSKNIPSKGTFLYSHRCGNLHWAASQNIYRKTHDAQMGHLTAIVLGTAAVVDFRNGPLTTPRWFGGGSGTKPDVAWVTYR